MVMFDRESSLEGYESFKILMLPGHASRTFPDVFLRLFLKFDYESLKKGVKGSRTKP